MKTTVRIVTALFVASFLAVVCAQAQQVSMRVSLARASGAVVKGGNNALPIPMLSMIRGMRLDVAGRIRRRRSWQGPSAWNNPIPQARAAASGLPVHSMSPRAQFPSRIPRSAADPLLVPRASLAGGLNAGMAPVGSALTRMDMSGVSKGLNWVFGEGLRIDGPMPPSASMSGGSSNDAPPPGGRDIREAFEAAENLRRKVVAIGPALLQSEDLPKSDALREKAELIDREWGENNNIENGSEVGLLSGRFSLNVGRLDSRHVAAFAARSLENRFENSKDDILGGKVVAVKMSDNSSVEHLVRILMLHGFAYGKSVEIIPAFNDQVPSLLEDLGPVDELVQGEAQGQFWFRGLSEDREVLLFVFANKKTGVYLGFYVRDGRQP